MASLILYNYFRSSTSYRARIVLYHKNLDFEYRAVHLLNNGGEQYATSYKDLNAMAEVPTLVHNGKSIAQSVAIIEYLEEVFPHNPLFPKDPLEKASGAIGWVDYGALQRRRNRASAQGRAL